MDRASAFSHQLRLRVSGLLVENDAILLMKIHSPVTDTLIWIPPGGGVEFGETMSHSLKREFLEETQVEIEVSNLLHVAELIDDPFHAVECYFEVKRIKGKPSAGYDPELKEDEQLIEEVAWISIKELEERPFAPSNLLPKLKHWRERHAFKIFSY